MVHEHDEPDYTKDPDGKVIQLDAHIRLANPRTAETQSNLMLRRGYSYSLGVSNSGQLDMGLLFVCYQSDLEKAFLTVQKRLNGEALEEYIKPIGGGISSPYRGWWMPTTIWPKVCSMRKAVR